MFCRHMHCLQCNGEKSSSDSIALTLRKEKDLSIDFAATNEEFNFD